MEDAQAMTDAVPWVKWHFDKWRGDPGLRLCTLAARGLWMDMLAIMHNTEPYGHLAINGRPISNRELVAMVGSSSIKEIKMLMSELEDRGVFSLTSDGVVYCRRMVRDEVSSVKNGSTARFGHLGGNPNIARGTVPKEQRSRPFKRSENPEKTKRILDRSDGKCHWCSKSLQTEVAGHDFFHVDHVIAIRDGGTNDEANLVAACAECNHKRARIDWVDSSDGGLLSSGADRSATATLDKEKEKEGEEEKKETSLREAKKTTPRGTRLPDDWTPGPEGAKFARDLGLDPKAIFAVFRDYWQAKPGKDGVKLDWIKTWRNWCRSDAERRGTRPNGGDLLSSPMSGSL